MNLRIVPILLAAVLACVGMGQAQAQITQSACPATLAPKCEENAALTDAWSQIDAYCASVGGARRSADTYGWGVVHVVHNSIQKTYQGWAICDLPGGDVSTSYAVEPDYYGAEYPYDPDKSLGPPCKAGCGNPINVAIGNKYQREDDLQLSSLLSFPGTTTVTLPRTRICSDRSGRIPTPAVWSI